MSIAISPLGKLLAVSAVPDPEFFTDNNWLQEINLPEQKKSTLVVSKFVFFLPSHMVRYLCLCTAYSVVFPS